MFKNFILYLNFLKIVCYLFIFKFYSYVIRVVKLYHISFIIVIIINYFINQIVFYHLHGYKIYFKFDHLAFYLKIKKKFLEILILNYKLFLYKLTVHLNE